MKTLKIMIDMDGTIEDILSVWVKRANQKFHRDVKKEEITDWDVVKAYPGIQKKDVLGILNDGSIWSEVKPIEGAAEVIKSFIDDGHKVYIVTASNYETLPQKMDDLLFRYFPFISWDDVIVTTNKQMLKADVLIDDAVHNMIGGSYAKILLDAPYNRDVDDEANGIIRVKTWKEIKEIISSLKKYHKETKQMPTGEKYIGLTNYLNSRTEDAIEMSFSDIEKASGVELPDSAYRHQAFWSNTKSHSIALSWINAGYYTQHPNIDKQTILFVREK